MENSIEIKSAIQIFYFQVTDLWKKFCEEHTRLFNLTCDEYEYLLKNDLAKLEKTIAKKQETIQLISKLENLRQEVIDKLNKDRNESKILAGYLPQEISSIGDLLHMMQEYEKGEDNNHLFRFNKLLIDIIEKIQSQNTKNQMFINKAIKNLDDIKNEIYGESNFKTYASNGMTK